ncbi:MAG: class I SAM-dependent methyltransferase [Candidatus Shapirobacteria bacterium]|nr:class I SAM-dependent methyltransferase [Candidatus Shapirobacteria bacterium]
MNKENTIDLNKIGLDFLRWSKKNPVGKIPRGVSKEGAGENRVPFAHLANSVPVYLTFREILKLSKHERAFVLDIGCGTGRNISYVKESVKKTEYEFFGVDYSKSCIDFARSQYKKQGVTFVQHDGKYLPFPDSCFDFVVSSHVLEHIDKEGGIFYFKEISRILKKGGVAIIGTPNRKHCQDLFAININDDKQYRLILPHLHEYYYDELKKMVINSSIFSKVSVDQTVNLVNRKLMVDSIEKIKPRAGFLNKIKYTIYTVLRSNIRLQDLMARIGTEYILKRMGVGYKDLIKSTYYIKDDGKGDGDNFIVIAEK